MVNDNNIDKLVSFLPLIEKGMIVKVVPQGISMVPFIMGGRDIVELHKIEDTIKRGDIILYKRRNGVYVLHRVYRIKKDGYYMLGDGQVDVEGPIDKNQLIAKCDIYYKRKKRKNNDSIEMKIKYHVWFFLKPARPILIKLNSAVKSVLRCICNH